MFGCPGIPGHSNSLETVRTEGHFIHFLLLNSIYATISSPDRSRKILATNSQPDSVNVQIVSTSDWLGKDL